MGRRNWTCSVWPADILPRSLVPISLSAPPPTPAYPLTLTEDTDRCAVTLALICI